MKDDSIQSTHESGACLVVSRSHPSSFHGARAFESIAHFTVNCQCLLSNRAWKAPPSHANISAKVAILNAHMVLQVHGKHHQVTQTSRQKWLSSMPIWSF